MLSFCCQLVNIVEIGQVQDILDNEAQFICCLNRLLEKLLYPYRKQSLSKGEKRRMFSQHDKLGIYTYGS